VLFRSQTINDSWLMVMADIAEHGNSDCIIDYTNISSPNLTALKVAEKRKIANSLISYNTISFMMTSDSDYMSPVLSKSIGTLYWHYKPTGDHYSQTIDFREGNEFDRVKVRVSGVPLSGISGASWTVNISCSMDSITWHMYNSSGSRCVLKTKPLDLNVNLYEYDYTFDISDNFSGLNLARYMKIDINMGSTSWDGSDTPKLFDLRSVVYEAI
jgi:hypothetical protein